MFSLSKKILDLSASHLKIESAFCILLLGVAACSSGPKPVLLPDGSARVPINTQEIVVAVTAVTPNNVSAIPADTIATPPAPQEAIARQPESNTKAALVMPPPLMTGNADVSSSGKALPLETALVLHPGDHLSNSLNRWLSDQGWTLLWKPQAGTRGRLRDFVVSDDTTQYGDIESVLGQVLTGKALAVQISSADHKVLVTNASAEQPTIDK